ncbi:hypothetical protein FA95DRAFT_1609858 [Auriscalpium vulgare]|uniref:Uncharacterized protein n=1 Tax=Auriscalpium vulgare TaxID=40419 RepID=A0ACB8RFP5_9AGAM|nr:hypothetical protein FA95DRAFT_1609858 [Auriscalpium vulgare]
MDIDVVDPFDSDIGTPPSPTPFQSATQLYAAYRTLPFEVRSSTLVCKGFYALGVPLQYRVVFIRSKDRAHRLQQILSEYKGSMMATGHVKAALVFQVHHYIIDPSPRSSQQLLDLAGCFPNLVSFTCRHAHALFVNRFQGLSFIAVRVEGNLRVPR